MITSKQVSGIFIVSGTIIGAGMLALPISSYSIGFFPSSIIMFFMFFLAILSSLNIAKINLHFGQSLSIPMAARKVLGKYAEILTVSAKLLLLYSLLSAYISGSVSILHTELLEFYQIQFHKHYLTVIITGLLGLLIVSSFKTVDYFNRIGCFIMLVLFLLMAFLLFNKVEIKNLTSTTTSISTYSISVVILLFFTSFGFQLSIHAISNYIGIEYKEIRRIFLIGTSIPLCLYIIWQIISLGSIPRLGPQSFSDIESAGGDIGTFVQILGSKISFVKFSSVVRLFTLLAIITSFIGVALGLLNYFMELLDYQDSLYNRFKSGILTFSVPLIIVLLYPQIFIKSLSIAASFLNFVSVIIPSLISLKLIYEKNQTVFSSIIAPSTLLLSGLILLGLQIYIFFG